LRNIANSVVLVGERFLKVCHWIAVVAATTARCGGRR